MSHGTGTIPRRPVVPFAPVPAPLRAPSVQDPVGRDRARRWFFWATVVLTLAPLATAACRLLAGSVTWTPVSDHAVIETQVAAVGHHAVALGPYSRLGFHFPGPALFYVLALPYRLLGGTPSNLLVGAVLVNAAAVVGLALVARRRGGILLSSIVLLAAACVMRSLGGAVLLDPWNPYITLLPFALLVLLAWSVASGDAWMLPPAVAVATFVVQSHVGYAPVSFCLLLWAVVGLSVHRRDRDAQPVGAAVATSVAIALVLWLPTLIDLVNGGDNLSRSFRYFSRRTGALSWPEAVRVVGLQWSWRPEWLLGPRDAGLGVVPYRSAMDLPVLAAAGAVAVAAAWRLRNRAALLLAGTLAVALLASIASAHAVTGVPFPYLIRWTWVPGALLAVLCAWVGASACAPRLRRGARTAAAWATVGALVALGLAGSVLALDAQPPASRASAPLREVADETQAWAASHGDGPLVLTGPEFDGFRWGLVAELSRRGVPIAVDRSDAFYFGSWMRPEHGARTRRLVVMSGAQAEAALRRPRSHAVVAHASDRGLAVAPRDIERARATVAYLLDPESARARAARAILRVVARTRTQTVAVVAEP